MSYRAPQPPSPPVCTGRLYQVRPGDNLYLISRRFNTTVQDILNMNPQITNPNLIYAGQVICVTLGIPRTCSLALRRNPENTTVNAGGVVWLNNVGNQTLVFAAGIYLPDPARFGAEDYTVTLAWGRTTFDVPMTQVNGIPGLWVGRTQAPALPQEFYNIGAIDIFPGPVAGAQARELNCI